MDSLGQLQADLDANLPSSPVTIAAINEVNQDSAVDIATAINDLPYLLDTDTNSDGHSDVWFSWWTGPGPYDAREAWRDVHVIDGDGERTAIYNLTAHDLRVQENYDTMRSLIVEAATAKRVAASPWQNRVEPMDVSGDGLVVANDVLRIINRINLEGAGVLPPPTGPVSNYYDVTGDNAVTAIDALRLIRHINSLSMLGSSEPESAPVSAASPAPPPADVVDAYFAASMGDQNDEDEGGMAA